jgi:AraC-like DNA-binding protein
LAETPSHKVLNLSDQRFIDRLKKIVEANLEIREFGVENLAREVGMSRSLLYRRLQSITNKSVSRFIRDIRLDKAKI